MDMQHRALTGARQPLLRLLNPASRSRSSEPFMALPTMAATARARRRSPFWAQCFGDQPLAEIVQYRDQIDLEIHGVLEELATSPRARMEEP